MSTNYNCVSHGACGEDSLGAGDITVAFGATVGFEEGLIVAILNLHMECASTLTGAVVFRKTRQDATLTEL